MESTYGWSVFITLQTDREYSAARGSAFEACGSRIGGVGSRIGVVGSRIRMGGGSRWVEDRNG
jgi:hypothetical protein